MLEQLHHFYTAAKALAAAHPDVVHYITDAGRWLFKNGIPTLISLQKIREYYQPKQVITMAPEQPRKAARKPRKGSNEDQQRPAA